MMRWWPLTLRGLGALVLAAACIVMAQTWGSVELLAVAVLLLALVAVSVASLYVMRRPARATRAVRPVVTRAGETAQVTVGVGVRTTLPTASGSWTDGMPRDAEADAEGGFAAATSGLRDPERTVTVSYRVRFARRGIHQLGPFGVTLLDPFGLARRTLRIGEPTRVVVAPAAAELSGGLRAPGGVGERPHATTAQFGQGTDNLTARPYLPGDSMRRIHWRATARHGDLMVREEEQEATPDATIVLDRSAARFADRARTAPGADPAFEEVVAACISIAARLVRDGYLVVVTDADGAPLCPPLASAADGDALATGLATLTTHGGDALPHLALQAAGDRTGPFVVLTGRLSAAEASALAPVASRSSSPVLLATDPDPDAVSTAVASGWRSAALGHGRDLADAWREALDRMPDHAVR
jgi:uncharacterized protein (DUF58 family)